MFKRSYNIIRNIVVGIIMSIALLYMMLYVLVAIPPVQKWIATTTSHELEKLLGGKVIINKIDISPFNKLDITDVKLISPLGENVAEIEHLGAGISIYDLLFKQQIIITYAEVVGLDARISQKKENSPLNIQYIIDAVSPKDKTKPPTKFDLAIHSIVLRKCAINFDKEWKPTLDDKNKFDPNHIKLQEFRADVDLPRITNDDFTIDVKRMSFNLDCGFKVKMLKLYTHITNRKLKIDNFSLNLPGTSISLPETELVYSGFDDIIPALKRKTHDVLLKDLSITPADFACFSPKLKRLGNPVKLNIDAHISTNTICINKIGINYPFFDTKLNIEDASISNLNSFKTLNFDIRKIEAKTTSETIDILSEYLPEISKIKKNLIPLGNININASGTGNIHNFRLTTNVKTDVGNVSISGKYNNKDKTHKIFADLTASGVEVGRISGISDLGKCTLDAKVDLNFSEKNIIGEIMLKAPLLTYRGHCYSNIDLIAHQNVNETSCNLNIADNALALSFNSKIEGLYNFIAHKTGYLNTTIDLDLQHFEPIQLNLPSKFAKLPKISFKMNGNACGSSLTDLNGNISIHDLDLQIPGKEGIKLSKLFAEIKNKTDERNEINVFCDYFDFSAIGNINLATLPRSMTEIFNNTITDFEKNNYTPSQTEHTNNFCYKLEINDWNSLNTILHLPINILDKSTVSGTINSEIGKADLSIDVPWIQQGKNKLIRNTKLKVTLDALNSAAFINAETIFPAKKSDVQLNLNSNAHNGEINTIIGWEFFKETSYKGNLGINTKIVRSPDNGNLSVMANVLKSKFWVNDTVWNVNPATINITNSEIKVNDLKIWREGQFALIDGALSPNANEQLKLSLGMIDLSYIFEVLDINFVTFGGVATGDFYVSGVTSGIDKMIAYTPALYVQNLSYNKGLLGDAIIKSNWDGTDKKVNIMADIKDTPDYSAKINGGIWVTRDSLSFDFDTKGVNVKFLQPFMAAFSSDVSGRATGHAKLFGTFSDIDLEGKIYAHPFNLKIDYTNVYYSCTDTIEIAPGLINIDNIKLTDRDGNSAKLNGFVKHRYFHDPEFMFKVSNAKNLLCYDTNEKINPIWYGTIYGNGGGSIVGKPGMVDITIDMETASDSKFTFILNKSEAADDYHFLTFTDKHKEAQEAAIAAQQDTIPDILKQFKQQEEVQQETSSIFKMDLRATINQDAQLTLVMDPVGGDRIKAYGKGGLQIGYDSENDNMTMFGRYTLDKGSYNFTLQDLIIKDFSIRPESNIYFNGDPYDAKLDIAAAYRVNANLTELDKSFSTDRDIARTNIPVDAMLFVKGEMQRPDITFDIEMPTMTQDVIRKIKSIISTEDMMNRQIVYLLALHRFYTPEYTGTQHNNNELASVASSTISAQIGNALGHLSNKFSFTPYFRTEKGDFSDMEMDFALSSSLFNNRLLINGNLGYRDRTTSTTTFVGDFDIEYLLNRQGTFRLKAYNHFNDANYYLRSALTTQGVGIIYKLEFNDLFSIFKRKNKKPERPDTVKKREN